MVTPRLPQKTPSRRGRGNWAFIRAEAQFLLTDGKELTTRIAKRFDLVGPASAGEGSERKASGVTRPTVARARGGDPGDERVGRDKAAGGRRQNVSGHGILQGRRHSLERFLIRQSLKAGAPTRCQDVLYICVPVDASVYKRLVRPKQIRDLRRRWCFENLFIRQYSAMRSWPHLLGSSPRAQWQAGSL